VGDVRRVYPRQALNAERMTTPGHAWWEVEQPSPPTSAVLRTRSFTDPEFAAHFVPADLIDDIIAAAHEYAAHWEFARPEGPTPGSVQDVLLAAVRRYEQSTTQGGTIARDIIDPALAAHDALTEEGSEPETEGGGDFWHHGDAGAGT
jgi:hypothetical protein